MRSAKCLVLIVLLFVSCSRKISLNEDESAVILFIGKYIDTIHYPTNYDLLAGYSYKIITNDRKDFEISTAAICKNTKYTNFICSYNINDIGSFYTNVAVDNRDFESNFLDITLSVSVLLTKINRDIEPYDIMTNVNYKLAKLPVKLYKLEPCQD